MSAPQSLKDPHKERRIFFFRAMISLCVVVVLTLILIWRLYTLQIENHTHYQTLSDKNRMQLQSVPPNRGLIYDRNGVILADNRPIYTLTLVKEQVTTLDETIKSLRAIIDLSEDDIARFKKRLKNRRRPYEAVELKSSLTEKEIALLAVNRHRFAGVDVKAELLRNYPFGESMAHVLGYVGRINLKELKKSDPINYSGTNYIGKLGVEKFYEAELHGQVGYQTVETNARGRVLRVLDRKDPIPGRDLHLSLDAKLQNFAMSAMAGRRGAIVAIEPSTGDILALVSTPSFDPNLFVTGIDHKHYAELRDSLDIPLFNRALRGQYPPGSTVKPVIGLAGLNYGAISRQTTIFDPGYYQLKNDKHKYRDWKRWGHGKVNLRKAITQSCDTFFYSTSFKLGVDKLSPFLGQFGLGQNSSLDISEAKSGLLPSRSWKRGRRRLPWFPGDSLNMGIGQGFMLMTPLQLATMTAVLANKGKWHRPHLLRRISEGDAPVRKRFQEDPPDIQLKNPDDWNFMFSAMENVMHGRRGTARSSGANSKYRMAGKTGTAQVVGIKQGERYDANALAERHRDHALFIGFAPVKNPKIAVALIVENRGGTHAASPLARKIFDNWLLRPLPQSAGK